MSVHPIITKIEESTSLPEIPKYIGEALNILLKPLEFHMEECIDKLSKVPELEATLINVLNYHLKLKKDIVSLEDAVLYLGSENTKIIIMEYMAKLVLPDKKIETKVFNHRTYWKHSIATAIACRIIAKETGLSDGSKMFTYGLIHDVGVTILDRCLPEYIDEIHKLQLKGMHQIASEKIVLNGITHTEIGMWICNRWGLSQEIVDVVGYHHSPFLDNDFSNEVLIMHLADSISTNYYERLLGNKSTFRYSEKIRKTLGLSKDFVNQLVIDIPKEVGKIDRIIKIEI
ncbi:MAG: HDOD domain-containing protein [Clostridiales bacterium]|nr:HDOD domain-containing protein [Clostridiales bacterium]